MIFKQKNDRIFKSVKQSQLFFKLAKAWYLWKSTFICIITGNGVSWS